MALFVQFLVILAAFGPIRSWRNDRHGVAGHNELDEIITIVAFVSNDVFAVKLLY